MRNLDKVSDERIIVAGSNRWGRGATVSKAVKALRAQGFTGKLPGRVEVFIAPPGAQQVHVDAMGRPRWTIGPECNPDHPGTWLDY